MKNPPRARACRWVVAPGTGAASGWVTRCDSVEQNCNSPPGLATLRLPRVCWLISGFCPRARLQRAGGVALGPFGAGALPRPQVPPRVPRQQAPRSSAPSSGKRPGLSGLVAGCSPCPASPSGSVPRQESWGTSEASGLLRAFQRSRANPLRQTPLAAQPVPVGPGGNPPATNGTHLPKRV